MASTLPTGTNRPVTPSSTTSTIPPLSVATTGLPEAIASSAAIPKDSGSTDDYYVEMSDGEGSYAVTLSK